MRIGLAVMRLQPLHEGHQILINQMLKTCESVVIGVGSTQESGTTRNPFSFEARYGMLKEVYSKEIDSGVMRVIPLIDIGAKYHAQWIEYLTSTLKTHQLPLPTDYFSGSLEDASWYQETDWEVHIIDRETVGKGINATAIRASWNKK